MTDTQSLPGQGRKFVHRLARTSLFYGVTLLLLAGYMHVTHRAGEVERAILTTYAEECQAEGCDGEEVLAMYSVYSEECLSEGCAKEEIHELGGNGDAALAMLRDFRNRGLHVDRPDFDGICPFCSGTTLECFGVVQVCDDNCTFPDGSTSSPYACGACLGFDF